MSNSKLVDYIKISPHSNFRNGRAIKKITIHHMAGNLSVETCGNVFQSREASSNYGIDSNGRVGMYVEEKDRSWASSNPNNDYQAVTIEVANDEIYGNWHVSDKALAKLIDLCTDICQRNKIEQLNYTGNAYGNLTRHNMFVATSCPGPYLQSKFSYIAEQVNKRLTGDDYMSFKVNDKNDGVLAVKVALRHLYRLGKVPANPDTTSTFGDGTEQDIKHIQKLAGIKQTGIADTATIKAIDGLLAKYGQPGDTNSDGKVNLEDVTSTQQDIAGL